MTDKDVENKVPIYKLKTTEEIMKYYDEWGTNNKYDKDMVEWYYTGPKETVNTFKKYAKNKEMKIYDAGCGTGLVGVELKKNGYANFDGVDLSQKLLDLVPNGLYKNLSKADLNRPLNISDNEYSSVLCVGTFTFGHVKPQALDEFVRITKNKGLICFTINEGIYEEYGFDKKIKYLSQKKYWEVIELYKTTYIKNKDISAWLCIATVK